jgi:hypothetical protein
VLLAFSYFDAQQASIDCSAKERLGLTYARAGMPLLKELLQPTPNDGNTTPLLKTLDQIEQSVGPQLGTAKAYG